MYRNRLLKIKLFDIVTLYNYKEILLAKLVLKYYIIRTWDFLIEQNRYTSTYIQLPVSLVKNRILHYEEMMISNQLPSVIIYNRYILFSC